MDVLKPDLHELLNETAIQNFNSKHIFTVMDFMRAPTSFIVKISEFSFKDVLEIRKTFLKKFAPKPRNALILFKNIPSLHAIIRTGIESVDDILNGGLFTGNIYEICGLPGAGKTMFCLTVIKNNVLKLEESIHYFDTKNDFCAMKMCQMLPKERISDALDKILVTKVGNREEIVCCLESIKNELKNGSKLKLIIIDSLLPLYLQTSDVTQNNGFLNRLANILNYLVKEYYITVLVTNLITLWNEGNFNTVGVLKERITCGSFWYKVPQVRIKIHKESDNTGIISMLRPRRNEVKECGIKFKNNGLF